jgi:hypothetical protein
MDGWMQILFGVMHARAQAYKTGQIKNRTGTVGGTDVKNPNLHLKFNEAKNRP